MKNLDLKHDTKATENNMKIYKYMIKKNEATKKKSCQQYGFINLSLSFKCWN